MSIPKRRNKALAAERSPHRSPKGENHSTLTRLESPASADPLELAITVAISQFLGVIGRLGEHNDFLERSLAASGGLFVWPAELLADVDTAIGSGQSSRTVASDADDDESEATGEQRKGANKAATASTRWNRLIDPDRLEGTPAILFRKLNADATLRRRLSKATLEWAHSGECQFPPVLHNARYMAEAFQLGEEGRRLIELIILSELSSGFSDALYQLEFGKRHELERVLSRYLGCDQRVVSKLVARDGLLVRVGLIEADDSPSSIGGLLAAGGTIFSQSLTAEHASTEAFLKSFLMLSPAPKLDDADTAHLDGVKGLAIPLLQAATQGAVRGVNLMLYGSPGTGKTELARLVAHRAGLRLYEVRYADAGGVSLSAQQRLASLLLTLFALRGQRDAAILLDEAEDIFSSCERTNWWPPPKDNQLSKAWITRTLEENEIPIMWTSNRVRQIDTAVLRRFAVIYEFVELPASVKLRLAGRFLGGLSLPDNKLAQIAALPALVPAQLENAARAVFLAKPGDPTQAWQLVRLQLNESRHAMSLSTLVERNAAPVSYDPSCLNLRGDMTPARLLSGLRLHDRAALCFYGQPGTGKTELAHHLARELDRELIVRSASDLLSMWVGETERKIAEMFTRAGDRADQVILLLDEADTFLTDRSRAKASWELSQTNEFLARMEGFPGIFICTTNLIDRLDAAILRRFRFRIEFQGMRSAQALRLFGSAFGRAPTPAEHKALQRLEGRLAPADFANVARQLAFLDCPAESAMLGELLAEECRTRGAATPSTGPIGFVH